MLINKFDNYMNKYKNITIKKAFNLAVKNQNENKLEVAQSFYNQILEFDPNHAQALNNLGIIFKVLKEYQKAKVCYERALKINPNYVDVLNNFGNLFRIMSESQKAKVCYEKAIKIDPKNQQTHNNLGNMFKELGNTQQAKSCYEKAIEIDPNHIQSLNNLGILLERLKEYQEAKACYEKSIEIDPNQVVILNSLGAAHQVLEENQNAKICYEKAIKIDPAYIQAIFNLGVLFTTLDQNEDAKACYEKIIKINPNNIQALNNLGIIFQEIGDYLEAKNYFEKAIKINPNYIMSLNNLGIIFRKLNEFQKAKNCYEKIIKIDPNNLEANISLGIALQRIGEYLEAKVCYEKVIEIDPNHANGFNSLGVVLQEIGEYQKAKVCYKKAIKINSNYTDPYNNLGVIYYESGEFQKAISTYEKALEINPNHQGVLSNLSDMHVRKLDNFDKAINSSYKSLDMFHKNSTFINQRIALFRLKHDVQQAEYLSSKNYKIDGIDDFQKIGGEILNRKENEENENNSNKNILLNKKEIDTLLPFYKSDHIYKTKKISGSCINPNKNWLEVEDEYFSSSDQIMYIDDFLSDEALIELREFSLASKVWNKIYQNKYLGAFSGEGFISPIHLQIAIDLKEKLPKLFGPHRIEKFWGFKYDSTLGKGINIHADFALHNLNFWITPDEYNNNKNRGGLKVYDAPAPDNWTFQDYNNEKDKIYDFLKDNNAKCVNVPYKFNRAVLFNSAYFHETDEIDFKDEYVGRRINNTYLFGNRLVKSKN